MEVIMTNIELNKLINKIYWENNQSLHFKGWIDEHSCRQTRSFFEQEIYLHNPKNDKDDRTLIMVRTYNAVPTSQLGWQPYCYKDQYGWFIVTVPKWGELTRIDIGNALEYVVKEALEAMLIFNLYYEGKQSESDRWIKPYIWDADEVRLMRLTYNKKEQKHASDT